MRENPADRGMRTRRCRSRAPVPNAGDDRYRGASNLFRRVS
jgi:hypothetical protein